MMETSWDGVSPTQELWDVLKDHAFECLEDIKGAQSAISTRVMLESLRHMGHPQTQSANLMKPQMASLIAVVLATPDGWATSALRNVHLASSGWDSANLSSMAFSLELALDSSIRLLFPAGGIVPVVEEGPGNEATPSNTDAAATEQPLGGPDLAAILATMQQGFARQGAALAEQKNAIASLSGDTQGLVDKVNWAGNSFEKEEHMPWMHG